jgi:hypothetical protein
MRKAYSLGTARGFFNIRVTCDCNQRNASRRPVGMCGHATCKK